MHVKPVQSQSVLPSVWVVVRRGVCQDQVPSTSLDHEFKITWSVAKSPHVAIRCDINIHSLSLVPLNPPCGRGTMLGKSDENSNASLWCA
ncbi:hypothetical protein TNCV_2729141, partial [Trichonephila clavipes]